MIAAGCACCSFAALALVACMALAPGVAFAGQWVTGDHHSHTVMSDGSATFP